MAGRRPLPTRLKVLQGTAQPCRMNPDEPEPEDDSIEKPFELSPVADKHWDKVIKELRAAKMITNVDSTALAMYCEVFAQWHDAMQKVKKYGSVIKNQKGHPAQSPYMRVAFGAQNQMRQMMTEFGMTPSSRSKVSVAETTDGSNPWDDIKH